MSAGNKLLQAAAGVGGVEDTDPDFANAVLLLNGDDAPNGGQNNTFLDSSSNAHTITRNGNVTQGSFSPFSVDDGKWGNYVSANGSKLSSSSTNVGNFGTADFSIEFWMYPTTTTLGIVASVYAGVNSDPVWAIQLNNGGTNSIKLFNSGTTTIHSTSADVFNDNEWTHVAVCREGTTNRLFVNGSIVSSQTDTTNYVSGANGIGIFDDLYSSNIYAYIGYLSNFRIVKGTAVYTSAFTPPTGPLTAISGTSLLTCQSNRFVDNSSNAHSITVTGTPKVVPFSPFPQTTAYSASTNGGSGYFDGNGDYLSVANDSSLDVTQGDFTIDAWVYLESSGSQRMIVANRSSSPVGGTVFRVESNNTIIGFYTGGSSVTTSSSININEWTHIRFVRSGSTFYMFINGDLDVTAAASNGTTGNLATTIGRASHTSSFFWDGYLSDVRIIKGTALSTTDFTPPTAPLTDVTNTSLLCNFTNASIVDATGRNVLETVGNAQIDTTTKKYGTGSMEFDGTGDYLLTPSSENFAFGTGDYTVEFWLYPQALANQRAFIDIDNGTWQLYNNTSGQIIFFNGSNRITSSVITNNSWYHIAITRSGTDTKLFIDGVQEGSTYTDSTNYSGPYALAVADRVNGGLSEFNGYIDDFRITKGIARYTANFTPPTKALPVIGE